MNTIMDHEHARLIKEGSGLFKQANPLEAELWPWQKNQFRSMTGPGGFFGPQKDPVHKGQPKTWQFSKGRAWADNLYPGQAGITPGDAWNNTVNAYKAWKRDYDAIPNNQKPKQVWEHPGQLPGVYKLTDTRPVAKGAIVPEYTFDAIQKQWPSTAANMVELLKEQNPPSPRSLHIYGEHGPGLPYGSAGIFDAMYGEDATPYTWDMRKNREVKPRPPSPDPEQQWQNTVTARSDRAK